jgi:hypothetical protein
MSGCEGEDERNRMVMDQGEYLSIYTLNSRGGAVRERLVGRNVKIKKHLCLNENNAARKLEKAVFLAKLLNRVAQVRPSCELDEMTIG